MPGRFKEEQHPRDANGRFISVGDRMQFAAGVTQDGKQVTEFRGTVARTSPDGRLVVNAGTPKKPKWVFTRAKQASEISPAKPATRGDSRRKYAESLTPAEVKAIDAYMGENYKSINGSLRQGKEPSAVTAGRIAALDSAVQKGVIERDMTLYRAMNFPSDPRSLVGKSFVDHGFVSTSEKTTLPLMMARGKKAFVRVKVPAGTNAAFLLKHRNQQATSQYSGTPEAEILLGRDSRFTVTAARTTRDGMIQVEMELTP